MVGSFLLKNFVTISVVIFVLWLIIIIGIPSESNSTSSSSNSSDLSSGNECKANKLPQKHNDRVTVKIVDKDDVFRSLNSLSYALSDLPGLLYGYSVKELPKGDYALAEICKGDKTVSYADLDSDAIFYNSEGDYGEIGGNYSNFANEQSDGSVHNVIAEPGTYTLYIYLSDDKKDWYVANEMTFDVN